MYEIKMPTRGSKQLLELRKKLNAEDCKYYVYIHYKDSKPIYVGKGTFKKEKPWDSMQRCFVNASRHYDVKTFIDSIKIVDFFADENFALEIETVLTNELKKISKGKWKIYNDSSGNNLSEKRKDEIRESTTGVNNPMFGKHHTKETKYKISTSLKRRYSSEEHSFLGRHHSEKSKAKMSKGHKGLFMGENHPMYGKHHTEEAKKKISENHADFKGANSPFSEEVVSISKKTGECELFCGMSEAERKLNLPKNAHTSISACCLGKQKSAYGYYWYKLEDIEDLFFK